jgi:Na+/proline symporter
MNRELRAKSLGATFVAADMSVATVVLALAVVGYVYGFLGAVWITICWLVGIILFIFCIRNSDFLAHIKQGHTLHEIIGSCFDANTPRSLVRLSASLVTIVAFFMTVGIEFFAGFVVFMKLPGAPAPFVSAIVIALIVIMYTVAAGFRGTTKLNVWRLTLIVLALVALGVIGLHYQIHHLPGTWHLILRAFNWDPVWMIAIAITFLPAQIAAMDMWQRSAATGGDFKKIRSGLLYSLPIYLVWLVPPYLGSLGRLIGTRDTTQNYIVLDVIHTIVQPLGPWWSYMFQPLVYAGLVAIIGCTADTLLNAMTYTFIYDVYPAVRRINPEDLDPETQKNLVAVSKIWTALLGIGSLVIVIIGIVWASIYDLVAALFSVQILLFWPIFIASIGKEKDLGGQSKLAAAGLLGGMASALVILLIAVCVNDRTIMDFAPLAATAIAGACFILLYARAPRKRADN